MTNRIVVFPTGMGRRWAFTAVLPAAGAQSDARPATFVEVWRTVRATPRPSDRAELLVGYVSGKMNDQYTAWEVAPTGSIRKRLHHIGQRMLSKLGPVECFLKSISKDTELVEIVYPNCSVNPRLVRRRVRHLAISGEVIHRRYMYGSVALLPVTALFGSFNQNVSSLFAATDDGTDHVLLPLPNVVMAWNLFRAYSHWRALQGSRRLSYLVTDSPNHSLPREAQHQNAAGHEETDRPAKEGTDHFRKVDDRPNHWVFFPSESLDSLLKKADGLKEAISDGVVEEICKEYPVDPLEILKWRDHRLPVKSFG